MDYYWQEYMKTQRAVVEMKWLRAEVERLRKIEEAVRPVVELHKHSHTIASDRATWAETMMLALNNLAAASSHESSEE